MKKSGVFSHWLGAGMLWLALLVPAPAQEVRVAVAADASLANLVDVTTSVLSTRANLSVLDRADLEKLGQEKELQSVLAAKDFAPVRLLPADGLVLLRAVTAEGKPHVFARLVAVQPGVVLREMALPDGPDVLAQAKALEDGFAPYWAKLASIRQGKTTALSLLGLRFEVDAPETRDLERTINMLLASRLSVEPDTLVLERWRLNDAIFEKILSPQPDSPFWTGSSLVDGSMRMKDQQVEVTVRLRPPQGAEFTVSDCDTPENLPALIDRLAIKMRGQSKSASVWKPADEAAHYTQLGNWCLDNRLYEEGAEAFASALALGDNTRTAHVLLAKAWAMEAYPDDFRRAGRVTLDYNERYVTAGSIPDRVNAATEAARLALFYMGANRDFSTPEWNLEDPEVLGLCVLNTSLRCLWMAYGSGDHAVAVADLRHVIQELIAATEAHLPAQPDAGQKKALLSLKLFHAGLWHDTPEETLAFYREILSDTNSDATLVRQILFGTADISTVLCQRDPTLDADDLRGLYSNHRKGPPWIYDWDGPSQAKALELWKNFILQELPAATDPMLQCDAMEFQFYSVQGASSRIVVLIRYVAFLQDHRDLITSPQGDDLVAGLGQISFWGATQANTDAPSKQAITSLAELNLALLKQHVALPMSWFDEFHEILNSHPAQIDVPSLLAAEADYSQWYEAQTPHDEQVIQRLKSNRQWILRYVPGLLPVALSPDALSVHRFWDSHQPDSKTGQLSMAQGTLLGRENHVWFLTVNAPHTVYEVDPVDGKIVASYPVPPEFDPQNDFSGYSGIFHYLEVTPQWICATVGGGALVYSRQPRANAPPPGSLPPTAPGIDGAWQALAVPPSSYKPRWSRDQLFLVYNAQFGDLPPTITTADEAKTAGSGLVRVSVADGACETLVSSRRTPPQNALDGHPLGRPLDAWQDAAGLHFAFQYGAIYTQPAGKKDWSAESSFSFISDVKVTPTGTLVKEWRKNQFVALTLMQDDGTNKILLANAEATHVPDEKKPVWNVPRELKSTLPGERVEISPLRRKEDLCLYYASANGASDGVHACLFYFAQGQKEALKIPLAFDFSQIKSKGNQPPFVPVPTFEDLQATDDDLIVPHEEGGCAGFWVIPWSDIDAYRAKAQPATAGDAAQ